MYSHMELHLHLDNETPICSSAITFIVIVSVTSQKHEFTLHRVNTLEQASPAEITLCYLSGNY